MTIQVRCAVCEHFARGKRTQEPLRRIAHGRAYERRFATSCADYAVASCDVLLWRRPCYPGIPDLHMSGDRLEIYCYAVYI